jgi:glycosyltransferase involved in cell wall biosynthesis
MKRIIFLNRFFFPDHSATSQILSDLAFHLAAAGHDIHVITSQQRYDDSRAGLSASEQIRGVTVHRVPTTQFGRSNLVGRGFDYASFYASLWRAVNRIAGPGDILVAKTDPPMLGALAMHAAKRRNAHLVNWLQDLYPEVAMRLGVPFIKGNLGGALTRIRDASLRSATATVVIGERMAAKLRERGIPADRIHVIPNWCDDTAIHPAPEKNNPLRHAWSLEGKFVVGYSGNLGRAHEFETILDAARRLWADTGIIFLIIGGGHFIEEFSRRVKGALSRAKIPVPALPGPGNAELLLGGPGSALDLAQARARRPHRPEQVLQHCRRGPTDGRDRRERGGTRNAGGTAQVRLCRRTRRVRCAGGTAQASVTRFERTGDNGQGRSKHAGHPFFKATGV